MSIRSYETGPINVKAAFTSDFRIPDNILLQKVVDMLEVERRSMDIRPGMRHKYTPLRFDSATGERLVGGRYLFDTLENVLDYDRFTSKELEFEPGVKFWDRPFFLNVDRHNWRVSAAHDFKPLATAHHINRLERWTYRDPNIEQTLERVWPSVRAHADRQDLSSVWLMFQPEEGQIGIVTVASNIDGADPADVATRSIAALESTESLGRLLPEELGSKKVFDRTSLILAMWLPQSRLAGGAPSAYPASPPHPRPSVQV